MSELSQMSMLELFRLEVQGQAQTLARGLLALEQRAPDAIAQLRGCMRAAHSLKGAARILGLDAAVGIAHCMEELLVAAQEQRLVLARPHFDALLQGMDLLERVAALSEPELAAWADAEHPDSLVCQARLLALRPAEVDGSAAPPLAAAAPETAAEAIPPAVLRLAAENVRRLLRLASESLVESRGLKPFGAGMLRLQRLLRASSLSLGELRQAMDGTAAPARAPRASRALAALQAQLEQAQTLMAGRMQELELLDRRASELSRRLYDEALACRMRPFADAVQALPRLVRELARSLGKQARLEMLGEATAVDRDMLERLDAPLGHLLRNAVDHGIELPAARLAAGKPEQGLLRLEARHVGGLLQISLSDDGAGIALPTLRAAVLARGLASPEVAERLSDKELFEFLFLPGFSLCSNVTSLSGRGVGLDVVQDMVRQVRGGISVQSSPGQGSCFQLQLPLTLSVIRALLVEIGGQSYAIALNRIERALRLPRSALAELEGRQYFMLDGQHIGLVSARQVLDGLSPALPEEGLSVLVLGQRGAAHGLLVDRFLDERELVVQALDARLGKLQDISAGALTDEGGVVLILDVDDLLRSVDKLASGGALSPLQASARAMRASKRVLVVDDSLTVRELQRKLLDQGGYRVDTAVDGMDGWNAVRTRAFDLVVTDIDMPRMDGIELLTLIRRSPQLQGLPVMIVSYKDRESDRQRGLDAGADYYLAKSSFHDQTLLRAVADLIGEAA